MRQYGYRGHVQQWIIFSHRFGTGNIEPCAPDDVVAQRIGQIFFNMNSSAGGIDEDG